MNPADPGRRRQDAYEGPVLFSIGFRPFFLGAGLLAAAAMPLWLVMFQGGVGIPTVFAPAAWHAHEMIFGFAGAVIAGFLLTAIPNWTRRPPLQGLPLASLFASWLLGRAAMVGGAYLGAGITAVLDLSFLIMLLALALREIIGGRNWRNLPLPAALSVLFVANLLSHLDAAGAVAFDRVGERLGIATVVLLICLIGGRIVPSFTRNWLAKRGAKLLPAAFGRFDKLCLGVTLLGLGAWAAAPKHRVTGVALLAAGGLNFLRLARWRGLFTLSEPLVWSLHLGFLWVAVGAALLGFGILLPENLLPTAGLHALTAGAIGSMTLAMMTRATLGHSGRALAADRLTAAIYLAISTAAALRVAATILDEAYVGLLWTSGVLWSLAFGLFVLRYGRLHLSSSAVPGSSV